MSISGVSSGPTVPQSYASNPFQQVRKDFAALKSSLNSNDLTGAQNAFATLQQDMQSIAQSQGTQQTGASSPFNTDLSAIGSALQNGDLTGAQSAFQKLQSDMQQARQTQGSQQPQKAHHHHHHHGGGVQNTQNSTSNPLSDIAAIGNALQNGDLSGAQKAFATLQQDMGNTNTQNTTATQGPDLAALSTALQSNDLGQAQNAFATLMQDLQKSLATLGSSQGIGTSINVAT